VAIRCEAPDSQGSVVVAPELIQVLLDAKYSVTRFSTILRYRKTVERPFGQDLTLLVGNLRNLQLVLP
jgi:hypothetical protein